MMETVRDMINICQEGSGIYVIGHKNPDSDSVCSAVAFTHLLDQLGISACAAASSEVNQETRYILDTFGFEEPRIIGSAAGKQCVLVDHGTYAQAADGMRDATVLGIIDHHDITDIRETAQMFVRRCRCGASASVVYHIYKECGIGISRDIAGLILAGILSDTRNMKRNVTALDREAYETLSGIAGIDDIGGLYRDMAKALASYGDLDDEGIFLSDYKEYEAGGISFGVADVNAFGEENVRVMAERMYRYMKSAYVRSGMDMLYVIINNKADDADENKMYMLASGNDSAGILEEIFRNYDGERFFIFRENLSRKAVIVPALIKALENRKNHH